VTAPAGYRLRGVLLPGGESGEIHIDGDGRIAAEGTAGSETLVDGVRILPRHGDAHRHGGAGPHGGGRPDEAAAPAGTPRAPRIPPVRGRGSPVDTPPLQARDALPEITRAARHLARPKRYISGISVDLDDPALLPEAVAEQAAAGDGWVKLVGDWIDRAEGDLAPLWPDDVLSEAIQVAHDAGARVTAHVFGTDALPGLIGAGIDCIEHGTGLTDDLVDEMARRGTALVPTLINVDTFPEIADRAGRYPTYAAHMRDLHRTAGDVVRRAAEAGVKIYAGTDAGGGIRHGRIADEIVALAGAGHPDPLGAASWAAREWLGRPGLTPGAPADLVVYRDDPRADLSALREPILIVLRGRVVHAAA